MILERFEHKQDMHGMTFQRNEISGTYVVYGLGNLKNNDILDRKRPYWHDADWLKYMVQDIRNQGDNIMNLLIETSSFIKPNFVSSLDSYLRAELEISPIFFGLNEDQWSLQQLYESATNGCPVPTAYDTLEQALESITS